MPEKVKVNINDKCVCDKPKPLVVNYDPMWGDGHVICNAEAKGCGKFIRHYDTG